MRTAIIILSMSTISGAFVNIISNGNVNIGGNGCAVVNGILYINGVSKGPLTPEQQQQLNVYNMEVSAWSEALNRNIQESFPWNPKNPESKKFPWNPNGIGAPQLPNFGNNWPFGPYNNPFDNKFLSNRVRRVAVPPFPNPPPFCDQ